MKKRGDHMDVNCEKDFKHAQDRIEQVEASMEKVSTRAELAEQRAELAETRTELAEARTALAEARAEQAETALQHVVLAGAENQHPGDPGKDSSNENATAHEGNPLERLKSRQREILQHIAEGRNTKEIAAMLHLSPKTVEYHRAKLMRAVNVHDIPGLVRLAVRAGLVPVES